MQKHLLIGCSILLLTLAAFVGARALFTMPLASEEPIACTMDAKICPDGSSVGRVGPSCEFAACPEVPVVVEDPMMNIVEPKPDARIHAPLVVRGSAHGSWFFEGVFPVYLVDENEQIIGETQAIAQEDWMRDGLVPFTASLGYLFPQGTSYTQGAVILMGANPSGLPENDKMEKIPIRFDTTQ